MTQAEFNEMLRVAIATAKVGGYYQSRWTGEELDDLASGKSLVISGVYPNYNAIVSAFPNGASGAYQAADTKNLYVWNQTTRKWESIGPIQGPKGENGTTFTPSVSTAGVISWLNNGGLANPSPVNIRGSDGSDGVGIRSIGKIAGTGAPGTTDTYAIYLTDGSSYRFTVYQGAGAAADVPAVLRAAADAVAAKNAAEGFKNAASEKAASAASSAETAKKYSGKAPIIQNGNWWTWNDAAGAYTDTGNPARGANGVCILADIEGYFAFSIDENGDLILTYGGEEPPAFRIDRSDGCLYLDIA